MLIKEVVMVNVVFIVFDDFFLNEEAETILLKLKQSE